MSNQVPQMDIMETDPRQLADLIAEDDIGERIWHSDELATMTRCSRRITRLDDVRVYRRVLTADEIARLAGGQR